MHCYRTLLPMSLYENMVRNISVKELDVKVSDVAGHLIRTLHFPSNLVSNLLQNSKSPSSYIKGGVTSAALRRVMPLHDQKGNLINSN
jgi:hypothetical protein